MVPKRKIKAISGIRDFSVCGVERIFLAVVYDIIKIYDVDLGEPLHVIKLDSSPRLVKLSPNGQYFIIYEMANTISIYETKSGEIVQKIFDVPPSIKTVRFSKDSLKMIYGSSQILCLWSIRLCSL